MFGIHNDFEEYSSCEKLILQLYIRFKYLFQDNNMMPVIYGGGRPFQVYSLQFDGTAKALSARNWLLNELIEPFKLFKLSIRRLLSC